MVIWGTSPERNEAAAARLAAHGTVAPMPVDVGDEQQVITAMSQASRHMIAAGHGGSQV